MERRLRPGAGRRGRDGPARRALRRVRRPRVHRADGGGLDEVAGGKRDVGPAAAASSTPRSATASTRRKTSCKRSDFTTEPTDEVCSEGHPMVIRLGPQRPLPGLLALSRAQGVAAAARRGGARARGRGRDLPQVRRGHLITKRGRFGPFLGCSRYPDCDYIQREGPPPPDQLPFEVTCPKNGDGHLVARRARRTGNVFWGCSATPSATSPPTTSRSARSMMPTTTARARSRGAVTMACA